MATQSTIMQPLRWKTFRPVPSAGKHVTGCIKPRKTCESEVTTGFGFVPDLGCLTNRFHVPVRLFSNISQMTSKCGIKNKKMAYEPIDECVTDVRTTF